MNNSNVKGIYLRGWLEKQKRKSKFVGADTTRRWFAIENSQKFSHACDDCQEVENKHNFVISFSKSPTSNDLSGWFFLSDVTSIEEHNINRWIIIITKRRTYRIRADDPEEHQKWLETLKKLCGETCADSEKGISKKVPLVPLKPASAGSKLQKLSSSYVLEETNTEEKIKAELDFLKKMKGESSDNELGIKKNVKLTSERCSISRKPLKTFDIAINEHFPDARDMNKKCSQVDQDYPIYDNLKKPNEALPKEEKNSSIPFDNIPFVCPDHRFSSHHAASPGRIDSTMTKRLEVAIESAGVAQFNIKPRHDTVSCEQFKSSNTQNQENDTIVEEIGDWFDEQSVICSMTSSNKDCRSTFENISNSNNSHTKLLLADSHEDSTNDDNLSHLDTINKDSVSADESFLINDWDSDEVSQAFSITEDKTDFSRNLAKSNFDYDKADCSFLPDDDFLNDDWDQ